MDNVNNSFGPKYGKIGPADNKSYKNTSFFNGSYPSSYGDAMPSLNLPPEINSTIKENPYRTNVEIEKDEVVLPPDMSALFKAKGKKHYDGGINVDLQPNSFVFSDDKSLAFDKHDHNAFELKAGGNFNKYNNTPAAVLVRNIDPKHYNKMVANVSNVKGDELGKKTSALMLQKYIGTIGNVAYLQEKKKGFPQGIPSFSNGSAPVYDDDLKNQIMQQKQYAKYGGNINPYNEKMQHGGTPTDTKSLMDLLYNNLNKTKDDGYGSTSPYLAPTQVNQPQAQTSHPSGNPYGPPIVPYRSAHTPQGSVTPTGKSSFFDKGPDYLQSWEKVIPGVSQMSNKDAQSAIYNYTLKNNPNQAIAMWKDAGLTNQGRTMPDLVNMTDKDANGKPLYTFNNTEFTPDKLKSLEGAYVDGDFGYRQLPYTQGPDLNRFKGSMKVNIIPGQQTIDPPQPGDVNGPAQSGKDINWQFTPWQKVSQGWNALQYADAKRYMPYRSQDQASYIDPALVNPQQAIGDMQASANQQLAGINTLNPVLRNAQAAGTYSQYLDKVPQVQSQYDNQNVGIMNQAREYNNQIKNNETATNMDNDQKYYDQSVVGQQNFDDLKSYLGNQWMNNVLGDVNTDQSLAYNELTQKNPAYGYDFKSGNFYRNPMNILDAPDNGNNAALKQITDQIDKISDPKQKADAYLKLYGLNTLGPKFAAAEDSRSQQKRGGMIRKNPYKKSK